MERQFSDDGGTSKFMSYSIYGADGVGKGEGSDLHKACTIHMISIKLQSWVILILINNKKTQNKKLKTSKSKIISI